MILIIQKFAASPIKKQRLEIRSAVLHIKINASNDTYQI
jgi:hypothetical protein